MMDAYSHILHELSYLQELEELPASLSSNSLSVSLYWIFLLHSIGLNCRHHLSLIDDFADKVDSVVWLVRCNSSGNVWILEPFEKNTLAECHDKTLFKVFIHGPSIFTPRCLPRGYVNDEVSTFLSTVIEHLDLNALVLYWKSFQLALLHELNPLFVLDKAPDTHLASENDVLSGRGSSDNNPQTARSNKDTIDNLSVSLSEHTIYRQETNTDEWLLVDKEFHSDGFPVRKPP